MTANLPIRKVHRTLEGDYIVLEKVSQRNGGKLWQSASKRYGHSTSAFAALGRLYQKDVERAEA